jgi:hypothetical protein
VLIRVHEVDGDQVTGTDNKETGNKEVNNENGAVSFRVTEVDKAVIQIEFNREE